ncbi:hypothetical protein J6590_001248 [Homalodisca vitripennis]|nr:hypothetical protein J6590_001248 [Homalodisca vitripennis]
MCERNADIASDGKVQNSHVFSGSKKKEGSVRRKLGRNPRIPFSAAQVEVLEDKYRASPYLSASDVSHLSTLLRLSDTRIKIWFQNRRARERRDNGKGEVLKQTPPPRQQSSGPVKSAFTPTSAANSRQ